MLFLLQHLSYQYWRDWFDKDCRATERLGWAWGLSCSPMEVVLWVPAMSSVEQEKSSRTDANHPSHARGSKPEADQATNSQEACRTAC